MNAHSNRVGAHGENGATFEESFTRLQEVVGRLSGGNLSLQDALAAYEEGMALADRCSHLLEEAELRVKQVSERALRAGSASLADLDQAARALASAEPILVEVETYEETTIRAIERPKKPATGAGRSQPPPVWGDDELDPLFDEE